MTRQQIINRAIAEVGVKENPPNSNRVKYNRVYYGRDVYDGDTGPKAKYPWCMTFIQWLFKDSGLLPIKTASCSTLYNKCKAMGWVVKDPQPGDIVMFKWDKDNPNPCQHVGFVIEKSDAKHIKDVEGNTSITSNDNGGAVMLRVRPIDSSIVAFLRPPYPVPPTESTSGTMVKKTVDEVAKEVIKGKWGSGANRRKALTDAGYNYAEVQNRVNEILKGK